MSESGKRLETLIEKERKEAEATQLALQNVWSEHRERCVSDLRSALESTRSAMDDEIARVRTESTRNANALARQVEVETQKIVNHAIVRWLGAWKVPIVGLMVILGLALTIWWQVEKVRGLRREVEALDRDRQALHTEIVGLEDFIASGARLSYQNGKTWIEVDSKTRVVTARGHRYLVLTPMR